MTGRLLISVDEGYGQHPVALLFLAALSTVGASLVLLLRPLFSRHEGRPGVFFWFPLLSLLLSSTGIWLQLSLLLFPVTDATTQRAIYTAYLILDGPTSFFLGMAYWLRLRVVVDTGLKSGALADCWLYRYALHLLALVPCVYWVVDVLGIVGIWVPALGAQADGRFLQWTFGAGNVALATNDLIIHASFVVLLLKQIATDRRSKVKLIAVSVVLSFNSCGLLTGAVLSFFYFEAGTTVAGSFWLSNVLSFLLLNITIRKMLRDARASSTTSATTTTDKRTSASKQQLA